MTKKVMKISAVAIGALIILVAAFVVGMKAPARNLFTKPYFVVYFQTGEVYIGKLSTFPRLKLTDIYLLQIKRDPNDPTKATFQLVPTTETLWGSPELFLNDNQIVFYGPIGPDSKVAQALRAPSK